MPESHRLSSLVAASLGATLGLGACAPDDADDQDLRASIDEAIAVGEAHGAEIDVLDLTAGEEAGGNPMRGLLAGPRLRDHMRGLIASQLPCSTIETVADDTLRITFGTAELPCTFRGAEWSGVVTVSYTATDVGMTIEHELENVTNGKVALTGTSVVDHTDESRHVVTDFTFTGRRGTFHAASDRIHTPLADGSGIHVDGTRDVERSKGTVHVDIVDIEVAKGDVVPQDGSYVVTAPDGRELTMTFARKDEDTILVTVSGARERTFEVDAGGRIRDHRDRR
jgi:hypothetical protein